MGVEMRALLCMLLAILSVSCKADDNGCKEMSQYNSDLMLPQARKAFIDGHRFSIEKVNISRGMDCGDNVYYVFEAKPAYANVGYHWIVTVYKATGKTVIDDGI
jgi:hypothetical protein